MPQDHAVILGESVAYNGGLEGSYEVPQVTLRGSRIQGGSHVVEQSGVLPHGAKYHEPMLIASNA